ncbi:MAG: DNA-binding protein [Pirellulaceae bacterium]|nr:MAG: DNA-binding protein [Pirellulaceae bacterium]
MASLTIENYIKTIYQVCSSQGKPVASTGELATALGVHPSTVTSMLKALSEAGLVYYKPYEGVSLTESGRLLAMRVIRRHRLLELFLVRTLNLSWDEVHDEAEELEHAVSDLLIDRIDAYLGHPECDPHGDPIPKADGSIRSQGGRLLSEWSVERPFTLVRVLDQSPEFLRYCAGLGLQPGVAGCVTRKSEEAGIIVVSIGGEEAVLGTEAARKLLVAAQ